MQESNRSRILTGLKENSHFSEELSKLSPGANSQTAKATSIKKDNLNDMDDDEYDEDQMEDDEPAKPTETAPKELNQD